MGFIKSYNSMKE